MLDLIFIAATGLFFAIAILYVRACQRLRQDPGLDQNLDQSGFHHHEPFSQASAKASPTAATGVSR